MLSLACPEGESKARRPDIEKQPAETGTRGEKQTERQAAGIAVACTRGTTRKATQSRRTGFARVSGPQAHGRTPSRGLAQGAGGSRGKEFQEEVRRERGSGRDRTAPTLASQARKEAHVFHPMKAETKERRRIEADAERRQRLVELHRRLKEKSETNPEVYEELFDEFLARNPEFRNV